MKKRVITFSTIAMVTLGGMFTTDTVSAEKSLGDVKEERKEIKSQLSKAESEIADILYEIKDLNKEIIDLESVLKENEKQLDGIEDKIKEYNKEIDKIEKRIEERNEILKKRIAAYQENGGNPTFMDVLLGSENFSELFSKSEAASTIAEADQELMLAQEKDMELVEEKKDEQEENKDKLEEVKFIKEEQINETEKKKESVKKKEDKVKKEMASLKSEDTELASLEKEIRDEIAEMSSSNENTSTPETTEVASESTSTDSNSNSNSSNSNSGSKEKSETKSSKVEYTGGGGSAISAGKQFIGNSTYLLGARNPDSGQFDCSGFVQWAYKQEGVNLPGHTGAQASAGSKISYGEAKSGDLVFFDTYKKDGHVGIYLGGGKFLGSQSSTGVAIADMNSGYWKQHFSGHVRRIK